MVIKVGRYQPIPKIKDPHIQEIAKFAVAEYNKQARKVLVFVSVVSGEQQVVAGTNYKLVIEAEDCSVIKTYEAVVYDKSWEKVRELTSFDPMPERVMKKRSFEMRVGGYQPIRNVKDPHVQEIGKFAVEEHNKQAGKALVFVRVVSGEQQVVAGTNYKLVIEAKDADVTKTYEAIVYNKPREKVRELTSFALVPEQVVKQVYQSLLLYLPRLAHSFSSPSQNTYHTMAIKVGRYQPIPNLKDPHVQEIAEFAVAKYNKQEGKALVFVSVVSGEQQVIAGTNYKLAIEAEDCGVIKTYEAVVYDKSWEKIKELTSFDPMPERVVKQRSFEMRVGGYQPIRNVKDPHIQEIGKFAVEEHNKQAGKALVFVRVVSGEQQVVAGTNYKLVIEAKDAGVTNTYEAVVYDKPWEKVRELTSFTLVPEQVVKQVYQSLLLYLPRLPHSFASPSENTYHTMAIKVGGYQPIPNIKDPHVQEIAEFVVAKYNKQAGKALVFVSIVSGEQQVVAGTNYKLVIEVEDCGVIKTYQAVVYDKSWEKVRELTSFDPMPERVVKQRSFEMRVGGCQPIRNVKDPYIQEIGKFAVEEHNKQAGKALVFVRVVSGEQQVVARTNYKLVIEAKDAGVTNTYEAVVYDKPWEKVRELTSFALVPEQVVKQVYQSLLLYLPRLPHFFASPSQNTYHTMVIKVGGYQPIPNIKDPHVQEIAEFAVAEYNKQAGKALVFVSVVSGEQQVVTGTNYKLVIEAEDCSVIKTYEAVVYDKSWEKVRELTSFDPMPERVVKQKNAKTASNVVQDEIS
ncbi:hypothetical protein Taro_048970 [Colocasia esculenta]|uniref:Cystatin domain-containing protein n=1 Tax=Colocasia esculenta TaxID=4460 RepID=A0A843X9P7_COLES|nr:hypothetical protein [Colocasia esculenta]